MNDIRPCVLLRNPHQAAPRWTVCYPCADHLNNTLTQLAKTYDELLDIDEITPGGSGDNTSVSRPVPGPRSPAVDSLLAHSDPRSAVGNRSALATVFGWAHLIRADRSVDTPRDQMLATVPKGRITMGREIATIRLHWDWLMGTDMVPAFEHDIVSVLTALRLVRRLDAPVMRIGRCPTVARVHLADSRTVDLPCDAELRVRTDADAIRCRTCGSVWPRARWHELGDGLTDYARLADELDVKVGTLWRWASEDGWTVIGGRGRRLVVRVEAMDSYRKRRGVLPLEQAG